MLNIFNDLSFFFEDCYHQICVREYARLSRISPPTASKRLAAYESIGLLVSEENRRAILYSANRENRDFIDLSRMYWRDRLSGIISEISKELISPTIILYGSLSKAEATSNSDIDIAILSIKKNVHLGKYEKKLGRTIHLMIFRDIPSIPQHLRHNILNGHVLYGRLWTGIHAGEKG